MVSNTKRVSQYKISRQASSARTLDDLPTFSQSASMSMASNCRQTMALQARDSEIARRLSQNMHSNSKQLFDRAIQHQSSSSKDVVYEDSFRVPVTTRLIDRQFSKDSSLDTLAALRANAPSRNCISAHSKRFRLHHTGPSQQGSLLYSRSPPSLASERIVVQTVSPPEYFRATPDITRNLKESNTLFRTVKSAFTHVDQQSSDTARTGNSSRFLLVPNLVVGHEHKKPPTGKLTPMRLWLQDDSAVTELSSDDDEVFLKQKELCPKKEEPAPKEHLAKDTEDTIPTAVTKEVPIPKIQNDKDDTKEATHAKEESHTVPEKKKTTTSKRRIKSKETVDISSSQESADKFPTYICPSSELKSREAYTRRWIKQSTFTKCSRYVPLID